MPGARSSRPIAGASAPRIRSGASPPGLRRTPSRRRAWRSVRIRASHAQPAPSARRRPPRPDGARRLPLGGKHPRSGSVAVRVAAHLMTDAVHTGAGLDKAARAGALRGGDQRGHLRSDRVATELAAGRGPIPVAWPVQCAFGAEARHRHSRLSLRLSGGRDARTDPQHSAGRLGLPHDHGTWNWSGVAHRTLSPTSDEGNAHPRGGQGASSAMSTASTSAATLRL